MGIIKIIGQAVRTTAQKGRLLAFLWPAYFTSPLCFRPLLFSLPEPFLPFAHGKKL
jgi:hypothetical protein